MIKKLQALLAKLPRKVLYLFVATVLHGLAVKFPGLPLPNPDTITDWAVVLIGAHTATDIVWIIKNHLIEVAKERRAGGSQP